MHIGRVQQLAKLLAIYSHQIIVCLGVGPEYVLNTGLQADIALVNVVDNRSVAFGSGLRARDETLHALVLVDI